LGMPDVPTQRHPVGLCRRYDRRGLSAQWLGAGRRPRSELSALIDTNLPRRASFGAHLRLPARIADWAVGTGVGQAAVRGGTYFISVCTSALMRCICHNSTHSPLKQKRAIVALVVRVASAAHCNVFVCAPIAGRPRQPPPVQAERASACLRRLQPRPYWQLRTGVRIRVRVRVRLLFGIRRIRSPEGRLYRG